MNAIAKNAVCWLDCIKPCDFRNKLKYIIQSMRWAYILKNKMLVFFSFYLVKRLLCVSTNYNEICLF